MEGSLNAIGAGIACIGMGGAGIGVGTIAGNFFDLLGQIQGLGDCYQPYLSKVFVPPMLLDGLAISG